MNANRFNQLVNCITADGFSKVLFAQGYQDWKTRIVVARFIFRLYRQYMDEGIELLKSVVNREVVESEDIEQKVVALKELGFATWQTTGDAQEALHYTNRALQLVESFGGGFLCLERGAVWRDRLELLNLSGRTEEALAEADATIAKFRGDQRNPHSYLYNAYDFKADIAFKAGDKKVALESLKEGLKHFPLEDYDIVKSGNIWEQRNNDMDKAFQELKGLTNQECVHWEF